MGRKKKFLGKENDAMRVFSERLCKILKGTTDNTKVPYRILVDLISKFYNTNTTKKGRLYDWDTFYTVISNISDISSGTA